jgi:hypothetical protein
MTSPPLFLGAIYCNLKNFQNYEVIKVYSDYYIIWPFKILYSDWLTSGP